MIYALALGSWATLFAAADAPVSEPATPSLRDAVGAADAGSPVTAEVALAAISELDGDELGDPRLEPGLALRWQITPLLRMDADVNPDFSETEPDPDQMERNLRFPLYLRERRPLLADRGELPSAIGVTALEPLEPYYSRSLVRPRYLLGLQGHVIDRAQVAVLQSYDESPAADVADLYAEVPSERLEGGAFTTVARMRWDVVSESHITALVVNRTLADGARHNTVAGADGRLALGDHFRLDAQWLGAITVDEGETTDGSALSLHASYRTPDYAFGAFYRDVSDDFESDAGFVHRRAYRLYDFRGSVTVRPNLGPIEAIEPLLRYTRVSDRTDIGLWGDSLEDDDLAAGVRVEGPLGTAVVAEVGNRQHRYLTILQSTPVGAVAFELLYGEVVAARVRYEEAASWHYDELHPYFGPSRELRAELRVEPHPRVAGVASVVFGDLRRPITGRVPESSLIVRGELRAALPGSVAVRLIGEGNDEEDRVDGDALIEWELVPGAILAAGYGGRFTLDGARPAQRVFGKVSLLW